MSRNFDLDHWIGWYWARRPVLGSLIQLNCGPYAYFTQGTVTPNDVLLVVGIGRDWINILDVNGNVTLWQPVPSWWQWKHVSKL